MLPELLTIRSRLLLLSAVIVLAVTAFSLARIYPSRARAAPTDAAPWKSGADGLAWYREQLPKLDALNYVPLTDEKVLRHAVSTLVGARAPGPEFRAERLADSMFQILRALAQPTPDDYLQQVAPQRILRSDVHADATIDGWYRRATGNPLPLCSDARQLLEWFWNLQKARGRPTHIATTGAIQVARTRPLAKEPDSSMSFANLVFPQFTMFDGEAGKPWIGPFAEAFPALSRPTKTLREVVARHETTLFCMVHVAIKIDDGDPFVLAMTFYYSPDENWWHLDSLGDYYPYEVCLPY